MSKNQVSDRLKKVSRKTWTIAGIIVLIAGVLAIYLTTRKVNVLTSSNANVTFNGYNKSGVANYNDQSIEEAIIKADAKKVNLGDYWTNRIVCGQITWNDILNSRENVDNIDSDDLDKLSKIGTWLRETNVSVTPSEGLSNGDQVKLSVSTGHDNSNPVKSASKKYRVHGLKSIKNESTESILQSFKISFVGFNSKGQTIISSNGKYGDISNLHDAKNGSLSNGDKIKVKLPNAVFTKAGVAYHGSHTLTATVSGLKDLTKIDNVDAVKSVTDSIESDRYKSDDSIQYTSTFINMYATPQDSSDDSFGSLYSSNSNQSTSSYVSVNDDSASKTEGNKVTITALYKVEDTLSGTSDSDDSKYVEATISGLKLSNNHLNIEKVSTKDNSSVSEISNSLTTEQHNLSATGVKIK